MGALKMERASKMKPKRSPEIEGCRQRLRDHFELALDELSEAWTREGMGESLYGKIEVTLRDETGQGLSWLTKKGVRRENK